MGKRAALLLMSVLAAAGMWAQEKGQAVEVDTIHNADGSYTVHRKLITTVVNELSQERLWVMNSWNENWFVSLSGGATMYLGAEDSKGSIGKRITPLYEVSIGKWIYPFLGARFSFGGGSLTGFSTKKYEPIGPGYYDTEPEKDGLWRQHWTFKEVHWDVLYDLGSKKNFDPYKFYHCRVALGAGISWGDKEKYKADPNRIATFYVGLNHAFRLNRYFDIICDTRYVMTNRTFDRERTNATLEGYPNISVGLTWNINPKKKDTKTAKLEWSYVTEHEIQKKTEETYESVKEVGTRNEGTGKVYIAPTAVFFKLDKYELQPEYKLSLQLIAKQLKESGLTMQLVGSADSNTGSSEHNQWLSEKRCESVRQYLVAECGIDPARLQLKPIGGVEVYSPFRLNRAVFIVLEDAPNTLKDVEIIKKMHEDETK